MNQKRTKPNKTRHNLRYERATWIDLNFLAKVLERTYTDVIEEALNRGMAWIAKKSGLELPSQAKTRIRKTKLQEFLHPNKKATPAQVNQRDPELDKDNTPKQPEPKEPEKTDEEIDEMFDKAFEELETERGTKKLKHFIEPGTVIRDIDETLNELYRDIQSHKEGRELTMEEYLEGRKNGKWR